MKLDEAIDKAFKKAQASEMGASDENFQLAEWLCELRDLKKERADYWGKLRHQAAIAAMQGMMANPDPRIYFDDVPKAAVNYADVLVEELQKEKK